MRISTTQLYTSATRSMVEGQAKLADIQAKIASGKNFTTLAEDPVGANQVVNLKREIAQLEMFNTNVNAARQRLELSETTLDNLNIALDRARELSIQAANNTLTDIDRQSISYEIEQIVNYAANLMNSRDAKGEYIFAGTKGTTETYQLENGRYVYKGDSGSREILVGSSVFVESSDPGQRLFESISGAAELNAEGSLSAAILNYEVTDPVAYRKLITQTGDLTLSVTRVNGGVDGMAYSLLDSAGNPVYDVNTNSLALVPYDDTQTYPETIEVELNGVTLTLSLPPSAQLDDEPVLGALTSVSANLTAEIVDKAAFETYVADGNLPLSLSVSVSGGVYTYDLQDAFGVSLDSAAWTPPGDSDPVVSLSLGGLDIEIAPSSTLGPYPEVQGTLTFAQPPAGSSVEVLDLEAMQAQLAGLGTVSLNVTATGSSPGFEYRLVDESGATISDINNVPVTGQFDDPAVDLVSGVMAALDGWNLTFNPDDYAGTQASWTFDPATDLSNVGVVTSNIGLISDQRLIDPTDLATYFLGDGVTAGAGDLELAVDYSEEGGYTWRLLDSAGTELDSGSYRDPAVGAIGTGVEVTALAPATVSGFSFALEVNGYRSGTLSIADGNYSGAGLASALQGAIDADPLLNATTGAGIEVSYSNTTGILFSSVTATDELQFAEVAANTFGMQSTTNRITLNTSSAGLDLNDGVALDLTLPLEQQDRVDLLRYQAPLSTRISFVQEDTNILNALLDTVDTLRTPAQGDLEGMADLNAQMALILNQLTEAQEQLSDSMATMGARLNNLDSIEFSNVDFKLMTQSTLSAVEDLDYAAASTELARKQLALEASFASFAKIQGLTLFDYIR